MMTLGLYVNLPSELITGMYIANEHGLAPTEHENKLRETLHSVYSLARSKLKDNHKHSHNTKLVENRYQVGNIVYLLGEIAKVSYNKKLKPAYTEPFIVCQCYPHVVYNIHT